MRYVIVIDADKNILKHKSVDCRAEETRLKEKALALTARDTAIAEVSAFFTDKIFEIDQKILDKKEDVTLLQVKKQEYLTDKGISLQEIENAYVSACTVADNVYVQTVYTLSLNEREVSKADFDAIDIEGKSTKVWNEGTQSIIDKTNAVAQRVLALKLKVCKAIDKQTRGIILDSGYTTPNAPCNGQIMSSSDLHRAKLEAAHNNRNDPLMSSAYPFIWANRENTAMVTITNPDDLHALYVACMMDLVMATEQAGNAKKVEIAALATVQEIEAWMVLNGITIEK